MIQKLLKKKIESKLKKKLTNHNYDKILLLQNLISFQRKSLM